MNSVKLSTSRTALFALVGLLLGAALAPNSRALGEPAYVVSHEELRDNLRRAWTAHATWSRLYLIGALAGLPDTDESRARLFASDAVIGGILGRFYGGDGGTLFTSLLDDQVRATEELVAAAASGSRSRMAQASDSLRDSAARTAAVLGTMNPQWNGGEMAAMTHDQADLVERAIDARLRGDWVADIAAHDQLVDRLLVLADALTDGIAEQFPDEVSSPELLPGRESLRLTLRELWEDHVAWSRILLVEQIAGLPDTAQTTVRLLRNQREIGNALKPFYGDNAGWKVGDLLEKHVLLGAAVVDAANTNDADRLRTARTMWYANAYSLDIVLAIALPSYVPEDIRDLTKTHLDQTSVEAVSRVLEDWPGDAAAFDIVEANALDIADMMSTGIGDQFLTMQ